MATNYLLMTATITPSREMFNNTIVDASTRLEQYEEALRYYLSLPAGGPDRILFCDNSGSDLSSLKSISQTENHAGRRVDLYSYVTDAPIERGKGYGELDILDVAYDRWLKDAPADTMVWKVTGRLILKNIQSLINSCSPGSEFYADFREVPFIGEALGGNDCLDTRFLGYSPDFYRSHILNSKDSSWVCTEKYLFQKIRPVVDVEARIKPRFSVQPRFSGVCGGSSKNYESLEYRAKNILRATVRTVAPRIWL